MPQPPRRHASPGCEDLGDRAADYFRELCGRRCNKLNKRYLLPADEEELKRLDYCHRMVQFIFGGKNYIGPVKEILNTPSRHKRRILDLGCGGGLWAFEMADEFPQAEVVGVDVAPIQPLDMPPNCEFELCDLAQPTLPYPSNHFDVIHARCISTAIIDYPALLREITRMLRPGGMILLVEMDHVPIADGKRSAVPTLGAVSTVQPSGAPGWSSIWDAYARALSTQGFDATVPHRLGQLVWGTRAYDMSRTYAHQAEIPIGFHHRDPTLLTVGQLAWMDFDLMLGALKPYLQLLPIPDWKIKDMIEDAQADLYYPVVRLSTRLHVVQGIKK